MAKKSAVSVLLALAASLTLSQAMAQEGTIEEIIVTASKRPQTLQEVPIAVSVVTQETIERAQVNDIMDFQTLVPSLRINQLQTTGNTNFVIRGFGNGANNPGIEPSVGVFIDGVYRSRSAAAMADMPNVERVEVLRGPQSTLFGKNASAGVINVVTAEPDMDGMTGSAAIVAGNLNQVIVKGDISGPLSDTWGFSLSGNVNQRDGYFENLSNGSLLNDRDRWGVRGQLLWLPTDALSFRLIADKEEINEKCCGVGNISEQFPFPGGAVRVLGGPFIGDDPFALEQYNNLDSVNEISNSGVSLQIDYDFANEMLLTSITAYREQTRDENADSDFSNADLLGKNINDTDIETFTQEFRLSQSLDKANWMVGVYYFDEDVRYLNDLSYGSQYRTYADIITGGTVTALPPFSDSGISQLEAALGLPTNFLVSEGQGDIELSLQTDNTISIYGQLDFAVTDAVTLTVGANYTQADKDVSITQTNTDVFSSLDLIQIGFGAIFAALTGLPPTPANIAANPVAAGQAQALSMIPCDGTNEPFCNPLSPMQALQFIPPFVDFPNSVESGKTSDTATTWIARIAWDASDSINLYASAGTGFKATSWNLSRDSRPFASDIPALEAAGLGVNNLAPGTRYAGPEDSTVYELGFKGGWDRNYLNVAVFYQEIEGFQSNIFSGTGFRLANAEKQSTTGVEVDSVWSPIDPLSIVFSVTWLDPTYDSFTNATGGDLTGATPAGIPEWASVLAGTYDFEIGTSMGGFLRLEYIYESEHQVVDNIPESVASRKVSMVNASAAINWDNGFEVMVWGRNLTEDEYLQSSFPATLQNFPSPGSIAGYPNQPRTYGITLTARFD